MRRRLAVITFLIMATGCRAESVSDSSAYVEGPAIISRGSLELDCHGSLRRTEIPPVDYDTILDSVALPTSRTYSAALQTSLTGETGPTRLWAKAGLSVRSAAAVEITLPSSVSDRARIGWDIPASPTVGLSTSGCDKNAEGWMSFPGGFWVSEAICLPVDITAHSKTVRVLIGVGAPCPGQHSAPAPSDK